jgi:hypothetical protein
MSVEQQAPSRSDTNMNLLARYKKAPTLTKASIWFVLILFIGGCIGIPFALWNREPTKTNPDEITKPGATDDNPKPIKDTDNIPKPVKDTDNKSKPVGTPTQEILDKIHAFEKKLTHDFDVDVLDSSFEEIINDCTAAKLSAPDRGNLLKSKLSNGVKNLIDELAKGAAAKPGVADRILDVRRINYLLCLKLVEAYKTFTSESLISSYLPKDDKNDSAGGKKGDTALDDKEEKKTLGKEPEPKPTEAEFEDLYGKIRDFVLIPTLDFFDIIGKADDALVSLLKTPPATLEVIKERLVKERPPVPDHAIYHINVLISAAHVPEMAKIGVAITPASLNRFLRAYAILFYFNLCKSDLDTVEDKVIKHQLAKLNEPKVLEESKSFLTTLVNNEWPSFYRARSIDIFALYFYFSKAADKFGLTPKELDLIDTYLNMAWQLERLKIISLKKNPSDGDKVFVNEEIEFDPKLFLSDGFDYEAIKLIRNDKFRDLPKIPTSSEIRQILYSDKAPTAEEYNKVKGFTGVFKPGKMGKYTRKREDWLAAQEKLLAKLKEDGEAEKRKREEERNKVMTPELEPLYGKIRDIVLLATPDFFERIGKADNDLLNLLKTPSATLEIFKKVLEKEIPLGSKHAIYNIDILISVALTLEMAKTEIRSGLLKHFFVTYPLLFQYEIFVDELEDIRAKVVEFQLAEFEKPEISGRTIGLLNALDTNDWKTVYKHRFEDLFAIYFYFDKIDKAQLKYSAGLLDLVETCLEIVWLLERLKVIVKRKNISESDKKFVNDEINFNPKPYLGNHFFDAIGDEQANRLNNLPDLPKSWEIRKLIYSEVSPTIEQYKMVKGFTDLPKKYSKMRDDWLETHLEQIYADMLKGFLDSFSLYNGLTGFSEDADSFIAEVKSMGSVEGLPEDLDDCKVYLLNKKLTVENTPFNTKVFSWMQHFDKAAKKLPPDFPTFISSPEPEEESLKYMQEKERLFESCREKVLNFKGKELESTVGEIHALKSNRKSLDPQSDKFTLNSRQISEIYDVIIDRYFPLLFEKYEKLIEEEFKKAKFTATTSSNFSKFNNILFILNLKRSVSHREVNFDHKITCHADFLREKFFYNLPIDDSTLTSADLEKNLTESLDNLLLALKEEAKITFQYDLFVSENLKGEGNLALAKRGINEYLTQKLINTRDPEKFKKRLTSYSSYLDKINWSLSDELRKSTQVEEFEASASFLRVHSNVLTFSSSKNKDIPEINDLIKKLKLRNLLPFLQQFTRFPNCLHVFTLFDGLQMDVPSDSGLLIFIFNVLSTKTLFKSNLLDSKIETIKDLLNSIFVEREYTVLYAKAIYELEGLKIHYINEGLIEESDTIFSSINRYIALFKGKIELNFPFKGFADFVKQKGDWESNFPNFVKFFAIHTGFLNMLTTPLIAIQYLDSLLTTDQFDMKFKCLLLAYLSEEFTIDSTYKLRGYFSDDNTLLAPLITKAIENLSSLETAWRDWNLHATFVFKNFTKELEKLRRDLK